jgi:hypothetical protein
MIYTILFLYIYSYSSEGELMSLISSCVKAKKYELFITIIDSIPLPKIKIKLFEEKLVGLL